MAKPNYAFEKRQKDIAKKKKNEDKRQRKTEAKAIQTADSLSRSPLDETTDN